MLVRLLVSIGFCQMAGAIGSIFTFAAIPTWYAVLVKPSFNPPASIFGPVWIILYTLMGISLYLVWMAKSKLKTRAIKIFAAQLILNCLWSILFFGLKNPGLAFLEIILLWFLIIVTMKVFFKINKLSAYLLVPYFLWVSFASFLNYMIWMLNK